MEDPFVICPFNKSHKIMMSRLQGHLLKCMKSHSATGPTICPFNIQHIIDASEIVGHCIICPSIKDVLTQANTRENKADSSNNVSSTSTYARDSVAETVYSNTIHSNTETKIKTLPKSLRLPENEKSETSINAPNGGTEKLGENKNPLLNALEKSITFENHHTITNDADSKNLSVNFWNEPESLEINNIDYGEIYRKLEALEEKEVTIAKEMQILRQKEKEIGDEKKELIEILKSIAVYMNTSNNYRTNNNNKKNTNITACIEEVNTDIGNNIDKSNKPAGSSANSSNTRALGRGIMRIYSQRKVASKKISQS
ncbi:putative uncharacterized protein DDB_G0267716 isoform X2 [Chelonus insularis]|uniref:putative uncharacterized protein DDB_G0267716 isoform X2 n=1 Tax=Chelonus insularis TaxID=460826 RepID=UPI001588A093|nr:putative uncharacterized protein DDB_G0267716 isoform X2 [Chelonus insularis]